MLAAKTLPEGCLDNTTAEAYINNMGGTVSSQLTDLVKELWMWAFNKDIILTVWKC